MTVIRITSNDINKLNLVRFLDTVLDMKEMF